MLTLATLGMFVYGAYSVGAGIVDLLGALRLDIWADLLLIVLGAILVLAAAFVRVGMPGCLALAMGSLLGLQALSLHNASHLHGEITVWPELARGGIALLLVLLAHVGLRRERPAWPAQAGESTEGSGC